MSRINKAENYKKQVRQLAATFLWHDYETFGAQARRDRPAQFAAIRTDEHLNEIGEPMMWYCQPAPDYLPDPQACLITGITPQHCLAQGLPEYEFAARIEKAFSEPGTIGVGYNTIRFDDEVTRFLFWRNLIDPYAREWQNGCGRWDLLDVMRAAYAFRPQGINWPRHETGQVSFRLEDLTAANGLQHDSAHDALSDVRATIALARLLRTAQPRLFDFCLGLRRKDQVMHELHLPLTQDAARPFLHVSGMFSSERGCLAVMWPLASHPINRNELLAWDLSSDPSELARLNAAEIRARLFTCAEDLPEGVSRLPIKGVHLNKSPVVVSNLKVLSPEMAQHWGIDLEQAMLHASKARELPDMSAIWAEVYAREPQAQVPDVDEDLYGGFLSDEDRRRLHYLRTLTPQELALDHTGFDDDRLQELVWRYRARNFPQTLLPEEMQRWREHCAKRLLQGEGGSRNLCKEQEEIEQLFMAREGREDAQAMRDMVILEALDEYILGLLD